MFKQLSTTERLALILSSSALAGLGLLVCLKLTIAPSYADFIVGNITWQAQAKFQDIIAAPVFIAILFLSVLFLSHQLKKKPQQFIASSSTPLSEQWIWWSVPFAIGICGLLLGMTVDLKLFFISVTGIVYLTIISACSSSKNISICPELGSLSLFAILLTALIPLEIALVLGRAPVGWMVDLSPARYVPAIYLIAGFGFIAGLYLTLLHPGKLQQHLQKLLLTGQIGLPLLFLTLFPARLLQPDGILTTYETTIWLKILVLIMIMWGFADVVRRYWKHAPCAIDGWKGMLSPIALFALLFALVAGRTSDPSISPDDYHFGESLLGAWSYLHGIIPYVGYIPSQGIISNDFSAFLSHIFYDGSAASMLEAGRLGFAILACAAFLSLYYFSGSIALAFVSTLSMGSASIGLDLSQGRWRTFLFFTPIICLWFSTSLRARPARWIGVWILTIPVVILAAPPQGVLLFAASGAMAVNCAWRMVRHASEREWRSIGIAITILVVLAYFTPLIPMLSGAIRYLLDNGPINQVAYGTLWTFDTTAGAASGLMFEAIRMSWVATPLVCLFIIYDCARDPAHKADVLSPCLVILLFTLLLIPYSMGRIDAGALSRPGLVAVYGWTIMIPIVAWGKISQSNKSSFIFLVACMGSMLNPIPLSISNLFSVASSSIGTESLKDGKSAGLSNLGMAHVQDQHWDRLTRLNALLNAKLRADESYLDLTSRNAQYFYLDRKPMMAVSAAYNLVPPSQQIRTVEQLAHNMPRIVLMEGSNIIHDGGGLALRNPYLYRFILDNYDPHLENGFIIGYKKGTRAIDQEVMIDIAVKNYTDANYERGISRLVPALIVEDPASMKFLTIGTPVRLAPNDIRKISKVAVEGSTIWFDGSMIDPAKTGYPNQIKVAAAPWMNADYRISLYEKAFSQTDFKMIPVAWGRSEKSLKKKMTLIRNFDGLSPNLIQLSIENGTYKVTGTDPQLNFDISRFGISGHDAGLLRFDFSCAGKTAQPRIQVFWWGDDHEGPFEASSIRFTADSGALIVPLDASPRWLMTKHLKGIRIDLDNASACDTFKIEKMALFQRHQ
ncbi:hypothetical protein [Collimonas humicola]|uniref:hypothetical protein n=1 Tax=Collimonas humicola TaxID=2825886 RepID=UPI001B8C61F2|nr:hypothetical protein [Collimonas humicola]